MTLGQYKEALNDLEKCRSVFLKLVGENHYDYAQIVNEIGSVFFEMGDY